MYVQQQEDEKFVENDAKNENQKEINDNQRNGGMGITSGGTRGHEDEVKLGVKC
jgi:hypothetical protein